MSSGCWLPRSEILQALKMSCGKFDRGLGTTLKWKFDGHRKKYFLPTGMMPPEVKKAYSGMVIELDGDAEQVEDILGDITSLPPGAAQLMGDELTAARLSNLKARTALIEQKLEEQKQTIWNEWNEEFFDAFAEAFSRFKNELISLHLSEEQLAALTGKLEGALGLMKDRLDAMWTKFKEGEKGQEQ